MRLVPDVWDVRTRRRRMLREVVVPPPPSMPLPRWLRAIAWVVFVTMAMGGTSLVHACLRACEP